MRRWTEIDSGSSPVLLVPVGSTEQHGPGLPMSTDTMVAVQVAHGAARRRADLGENVLVAPPLAYGASGEHEDFPGTISIGREALRLLLVEYARSACRWAHQVVFVNGHGGNVCTLVDAVRQLRYEQRPVAWTACVPTEADAHAGATETSLMMAMAPELVRTDLLAPGETGPIKELMPRLRAAGVRAVSASGVLGDPTSATREEGDRLLRELVAQLDSELSRFEVNEQGRLVRVAVSR